MSLPEGQASEVRSRAPEFAGRMAPDFDFATWTSEMFTFLVRYVLAAHVFSST